MNNIVKGSFVVLSDFHAIKWPLEKVKDYYLNEYDKIFILGDATDRGKDWQGTGGIELLQEIKELSDKYPNRVIYIPGNHDVSLYDYAKYKDEDGKHLTEINGGYETIEEIDMLKRQNKEQAEELIEWLGNLPMQRIHEYNNQKYALAHAFFNQWLYDNKPDFSLEHLHGQKMKYGKDDEHYKYLLDIVWFRKNKDNYYPLDLPKNDVIEIVGHTPLSYRGNNSLDLERKDGSMLKVYCVDGGIAYDGRMLKFDGGYEPTLTEHMYHNDTSPKRFNMNDRKTLLSIHNKLRFEISNLLLTKDMGFDVIVENFVLMSEEVPVDKIKATIVAKLSRGKESSSSKYYDDMLKKYIITVGLENIVINLFDKMNYCTSQVLKKMSDWLEKNNINTFDETLQIMANNIGVDNVNRFFPEYKNELKKIIADRYKKRITKNNYLEEQQTAISNYILDDCILEGVEEDAIDGCVFKKVSKEYFNLLRASELELLNKFAEDRKINIYTLESIIKSFLGKDDTSELTLEDMKKYIVDVVMDYITKELINFNIEQQKNNPYVDSLVYPNQDEAEFYAKASMETWLMSCEDGNIDYNYIPGKKEQSYARLLARNIGAKNVISVYGSYFDAIDSSFNRVLGKKEQQDELSSIKKYS